MSVIHFQVNYQVHRKEKLEHFLNAYSEAVDKDLVDLKIERYGKFENQWQATFHLILPNLSKADFVYEQLLLANALSDRTGGRWTVLGPHDDGKLHFECICNNYEAGQPLRWAHLTT